MKDPKIEDILSEDIKDHFVTQVIIFITFLVSATAVIVFASFLPLALPIDFLSYFDIRFSLVPIILGAPLFLSAGKYTANKGKEYRQVDWYFWTYRPIYRFLVSTYQSLLSGVVEELGRWSWFVVLTLITLSVTPYINLYIGSVSVVHFLSSKPGLMMIGLFVGSIISVISHGDKTTRVRISMFLMGLYFFFVIVNYGVFYAMIVHFAYDFMIAIINFYYRL